MCLPPDVLEAIATFLTDIELQLGVVDQRTSWSFIEAPDFGYDVEIQQSAKTLHRWAFQTTANHPFAQRSVAVNLGMVGSTSSMDCDLGAVVRFASMPRSWVKPMVRLAKTHNIVNLGEVLRTSTRRGTRFNWIKSPLVERISLDSEVLESLHKVRINALFSV